MLTFSQNQLATAQVPSDARAVDVLANTIARHVTAKSPLIPAVLTRINVRVFLTSLTLHGIDTLDAQTPLAMRYFAAGAAMARAPYSNRWRQILIAGEMTVEAKVKQLSQLLTQAEIALK